MPINVILADDHAMFRQGLAPLLEAAKDLALLACAANGREAWELIETLRPDVTILDISMPEMTGIEVARKTVEANIDTRVIVLTMYEDPSAAIEAQDAWRRRVRGPDLPEFTLPRLSSPGANSCAEKAFPLR